MELSIIIPTLNEEKYLPRLLSCLENQTFKDFEVVVADANSKDRTRSIAQKWGAKVVDGGTTSYGRNIGAQYAKGELLVFMDSDILFEDDFLEKSINSFHKGKYIIANPSYKYKDTDKPLAVASSVFFDINRKLRQRTWAPLGTGECLFITKKAFEDLKGFNEKLSFGEDSDLIKRAQKKKYRFGVLKSKFMPSYRRLDNENLLKLIAIIWIFTVLGIIRLNKRSKVQKFVSDKYGGWGKHQ